MSTINVCVLQTEEGYREEEALERCRARTMHAEEASTREPEGRLLWRCVWLCRLRNALACAEGGLLHSSMPTGSQKALDRLLCDHLHRAGWHESAAQLAAAAGCELLVDSKIYRESQDVEAALRNGSCAEALAWCAEHRSKLLKIKARSLSHTRLQHLNPRRPWLPAES